MNPMVGPYFLFGPAAFAVEFEAVGISRIGQGRHGRQGEKADKEECRQRFFHQGPPLCFMGVEIDGNIDSLPFPRHIVSRFPNNLGYFYRSLFISGIRIGAVIYWLIPIPRDGARVSIVGVVLRLCAV